MRSAAVLLSTTRSKVRATARLTGRPARRSARAVTPSARPHPDRMALLTRRAKGMSRRYVHRRRPPPPRVRDFVPARLH
jgi:hypothetical protein